MTRITRDHLARGAFIYVRQSTSDQVLNNRESRRRQYGLADRARALGWAAVEVIDDDLGRSGSGIARPGFEKLLALPGIGQGGDLLKPLGDALDAPYVQLKAVQERCRAPGLPRRAGAGDG